MFEFPPLVTTQPGDAEDHVVLAEDVLGSDEQDKWKKLVANNRVHDAANSSGGSRSETSGAISFTLWIFNLIVGFVFIRLRAMLYYHCSVG
ncbi:hypothetical protein M5689_006679 [Euphorbia peplus]|nr:hypothetical protein M5689_006679 [Euphorbia peplus]